MPGDAWREWEVDAFLLQYKQLKNSGNCSGPIYPKLAEELTISFGKERWVRNKTSLKQKYKSLKSQYDRYQKKVGPNNSGGGSLDFTDKEVYWF